MWFNQKKKKNLIIGLDEWQCDLLKVFKFVLTLNFVKEKIKLFQKSNEKDMVLMNDSNENNSLFKLKY